MCCLIYLFIFTNYFYLRYCPVHFSLPLLFYFLCVCCLVLVCVCTCLSLQKSAWKRLGGGMGHMQNRALADIVSRLEQGGNMGQSQTEDSRTRRRKLYRLASEQKPAFPFQQRNFYSYVMENKEVLKMLSLLSTCTIEVKSVSERLITF